MEFSSPRFSRINSRHSWVPSCGRAFVEARNKRSKTFAVVKLLAKLMSRVFAGNPADTDPIKHAVGRIILLNKNRRVGNVEAVAETFRVAAVPESAHPDGEKTLGRTAPRRENFHPPRPHR